jgi:hypothetical protein
MGLYGLSQNGDWACILQGNRFHDFLEELAQVGVIKQSGFGKGKPWNRFALPKVGSMSILRKSQLN